MGEMTTTRSGRCIVVLGLWCGVVLAVLAVSVLAVMVAAMALSSNDDDRRAAIARHF